MKSWNQIYEIIYYQTNKKCTDCVQPNGTKTTKNGKNIFCACADCKKEKQHLQRLVAVLLEEVLRELWIRAVNNR